MGGGGGESISSQRGLGEPGAQSRAPPPLKWKEASRNPELSAQLRMGPCPHPAGHQGLRRSCRLLLRLRSRGPLVDSGKSWEMTNWWPPQPAGSQGVRRAPEARTQACSSPLSVPSLIGSARPHAPPRSVLVGRLRLSGLCIRLLSPRACPPTKSLTHRPRCARQGGTEPQRDVEVRGGGDVLTTCVTGAGSWQK